MKKRTAKVAAPAQTRKPLKRSIRASAKSVSTRKIAAEFDEVTAFIEEAHLRAYRAVNVQLIDLYWTIGEMISRRIDNDGWGKGTVESLSLHLVKSAHGTRGFSPQNLWRMRQFFEAYRDTPDLSTLVRELPWSAHLHILSGAKRPDERQFYLRMAIKNQWNVRELARQIEASAFERAGRTASKWKARKGAHS